MADFSFSIVVTPECSQELTQTPRGLSPLVDFMTARLANIQISDSNDEIDKETIMSSSEDETLGEDFSQQLHNSKDRFSKGIWEAYRQKEKPEPYVT